MARAAYVEPAGVEMAVDTAAARALLAQKEQDLVLAAELGKALLEKNEQLSAENERTAAEYSRHLEDLEQERHTLRLRMSAMEGEHEAQVVQLQADIASVREQIQRQQHSGKDSEKQRSQMIEDITEQNQRLARQLRDAMKSEKQVTEQLEQLRAQKDLRRDSFEFHVSHVDAMREEIQTLSEQRLDLERRERSLLEERARLAGRLQELAERRLLLERLGRERGGQMLSSRRQLEQIHAANTSLTERLEAAAGLSPASTGHPSLRNELDSSADEGIGSVSHPPSVEVTLMDFGDDVECDEPPVSDGVSSELRELRQEVLLTAGQMRALAEQALAGRAGAAPSSDVTLAGPPSSGQDQSGRLREAFDAMQAQVEPLLPTLPDVCGGCGRPAQLPLQDELQAVRRQHDQLEQRHRQQTEALEQLEQELARHGHQLAMREKQFIALQEEKDVLKADLEEAYVAKEDLVRKAWEARDQAVQRKNAAELELSKARIDVLQTNSQLLDSIQHKVRLSCQLDQWQSDMQELLEAEMQKKLTRTERKPRDTPRASSAVPSRGRRSIMRLFGR